MVFVIWIIIALILAAVLFWLTSEKHNRRNLEEEVERARNSMDADLYRELQELLSEGKRTEAITRLRKETGVSLYAATRGVDSL